RPSPRSPAVLVLAPLVWRAAAPTGCFTLSLHDALPIYRSRDASGSAGGDRSSRPSSPTGGPDHSRQRRRRWRRVAGGDRGVAGRSEEHTSELQSRENLVCRLLLEKKKPHHAAVHVAPPP